jgi:hypothetical protein
LKEKEAKRTLEKLRFSSLFEQFFAC